MRWTRKNIVAEIKKLHAQGVELNYATAETENLNLVRAAAWHFGTWRRAVEAAGIDYESICKYRRWTRERIVARIRELHAEGTDLSWRSVSNEVDPPLAAAALRPNGFNSWREAIAAAGLDINDVARYQFWDEARVLRDIKALRRARAPLSSKAVQSSNQPLFCAARRRFGSWDEAIAAAGISVAQTRLRRSITHHTATNGDANGSSNGSSNGATKTGKNEMTAIAATTGAATHAEAESGNKAARTTRRAKTPGAEKSKTKAALAKSDAASKDSLPAKPARATARQTLEKPKKTDAPKRAAKTALTGAASSRPAPVRPASPKTSKAKPAATGKRGDKSAVGKDVPAQTVANKPATAKQSPPATKKTAARATTKTSSKATERTASKPASRNVESARVAAPDKTKPRKSG